MESFDRHRHWENIYRTRELTSVSWFQPIPTTSLEFIRYFEIPRQARIIDIGGGDSFLVDHLLKLGFSDITVLDISETAIERARKRLGEDARRVKWIVSDVNDFNAREKYDLWHDRAAFHFLTAEKEIANYVEGIRQAVVPGGIAIIGTFSEQGPTRCSGIEIRQYSERSLSALMHGFFDRLKCITVDHATPFDTVQNFVFCAFRRREALS